VISMFYASCGDACPLLVAEIQRIEAEVSPSVRAHLRVVLVSLDPARDTPDALQAFARARHIDESRWRLLRAPDDTVREIAAALGQKYRRLSDGSFNHSSLITLLDTSGGIVTRVEGIGKPHREFLERLRAAPPPSGR
jgi:protein SCO1/2